MRQARMIEPSMKTIEAIVDIEASPEAVWAVLMDWTAYPSWNPSIRAITGKTKVGSRIHVSIGLSNGTVPITAIVTRSGPDGLARSGLDRMIAA